MKNARFKRLQALFTLIKHHQFFDPRKNKKNRWTIPVFGLLYRDSYIGMLVELKSPSLQGLILEWILPKQGMPWTLRLQTALAGNLPQGRNLLYAFCVLPLCLKLRSMQT